MEYRNRKTGFVFSTKSEVTGADWVAIKTAAQAPLSAAPEKDKAKPKKAVKANGK